MTTGREDDSSFESIRGPKSIGFAIVFCLVVLAGTKLFSYQGLPKFVIGLFDAIMMATLLIWALWAEFLRSGNAGVYRKFVLAIFLLPFSSIFTAFFYHDQDPYQTVWAQKGIFYWSMYFVLHGVQIKPRVLLNVLAGLGIVWAIINIAQQFTYPYVPFLGKESDNPDLFVNFRAGIYRFMMLGAELAVFSGLYYFSEALSRFRISTIVLFVIATIGVYYCGTRQILLAYAVSIVAVFCVSSARYWQRNFFYILAIGASAVILLAFWSDELFGELTTVTLHETNTENVRWKAMLFFLTENWSGFWTVIFGNGPFFLSDTSASVYGQEMDYIRKTFGYFHSDVGVFGAVNLYGLAYAIIIVAFLIKILIDSLPREMYFVGFFVYTLWVLPLNFLFVSSSVIPLYCAIIYCAESLEEARFNK